MSGNAFISYYLSPVLTSVGLTSSFEQTLINATQQMLSWGSALYFATLSGKVGHRALFLGFGDCLFICLVSITTGSAVFANDPATKAAGGAVVASHNLRMRCQACFQLFSTCLSLLFTYAVPVGLQKMVWKFYLNFIPWTVIEFIVGLLRIHGGKRAFT